MSARRPRRFARVATQAVRLALVALIGATSALSCTSPPASGEFGTFRFAGRAKGAAPLSLLPPTSDRSGNVYILYGGLKVPEIVVYAGKNGGGWTSGCSLTKGDAWGVHGWVGFDQEHAWYWSGDALVSVGGRTGDCHRVLDHDPGTDANLIFRAILPWVRDAPSRRSLVALVQSPVDLLPFSARVDLANEILTNVNPFTPGDATDLKVLGVGADRANDEGVVVLQYSLAGEVRTEARFYDAEATLLARTSLPLDAAGSEYTVRGSLQYSEKGLVAGVIGERSVLTFDKGGGRVIDVTSMDPVGVHRRNGALFLVGTAGNGPAIAQIDDGGGIAEPEVWTSSARALDALQGPIDVRDDRVLPSRMTTFEQPVNAIGPFPFVSEHSLVEHAPNTTLWVVAGPSFDSGGAKVTAFAMAPVGVTYP